MKENQLLTKLLAHGSGADILRETFLDLSVINEIPNIKFGISIAFTEWHGTLYFSHYRTYFFVWDDAKLIARRSRE